MKEKLDEAIISFTLKGDVVVERGAGFEIIYRGTVWLTAEQAREATLLGWAILPQHRPPEGRDLVKVFR
jgi:hypothetical protein